MFPVKTITIGMASIVLPYLIFSVLFLSNVLGEEFVVIDETTDSKETNRLKPDENNPKAGKVDGPSQSLYRDLAFLASENFVYTASKRLEALQTAPTAMTVITSDHLSVLDARYLPQVLRLFPGLDVLQITRTEFTVGLRGFSSSSNFRPRDILVLVDGRTVYDDFSGNVEWENLDIFPQDAGKIEVILGAGSAIHGANAARGVINILTKPPVAISGFESDTSFVNHGFRQRVGASYIDGPYSWKITGGYDQVDLWNRFAQPTLQENTGDRTWRFNTVLTKELTGNGEFRIGAGTNTGRILQHSTSAFEVENHQTTDHVQVEYESPQLLIRSFWNYRHLESFGPLSGSFLTERSQNMYDFEAIRRIQNVGKNSFSFGGNLRYTAVDSRSINGDVGQVTGGIFADDQYNLTGRFLVRVAGRLDYHQEAGLQFSPRVGLAYEVLPKHTLKVSVNVGYRSPTISNNFFDVSLGGTALRGNRDLAPEQSIWYETGYLYQSIPGVTLGVDLFYVRVDEIIESVSSADFSVTTFVNSGSMIKGSGGELWGQVDLTPSVRVLANYGYAEYRQDAVDIEGTAPHKFNFGVLFADIGGLSGAVIYHFVNRTRLPFLAGEFQENPSQVDSYYVINAFMGYRIAEHMSVRAAVLNLTDRRHREIPPVGEVIGREISFTFSYNI